MNQTIDIFVMVILAIAGAAVYRTLVIRVDDACRQSTPDKLLCINLVSGEYHYFIRDSDRGLPPVSGPLTGLAFN